MKVLTERELNMLEIIDSISTGECQDIVVACSKLERLVKSMEIVIESSDIITEDDEDEDD